jgi:hypothetical protein
MMKKLFGKRYKDDDPEKLLEKPVTVDSLQVIQLIDQ